MRDFPFLANWDGFRPYKDQSAKSMDIASLIFLGLPPHLRTQPELMFVWWGVSKHISNLNPFLDFALDEFADSVDLKEDPSRASCFSPPPPILTYTSR